MLPHFLIESLYQHISRTADNGVAPNVRLTATLEGYIELHRSVTVRMENTALEAPLENLPRLYQVWGTLKSRKPC